MYITSRLGNENAFVVQYSLSTPFDISTATRSFSDGDGTQLTCSTNMKLPHAIEFKPDGTKMFVATNKDFSGNPGVAIFQFKLNTAWDSSTLVCEKIYEVTETGVYVENQLRTLAFKPDGTRMFVGGKTTDKIRQFDLSNAWDLRSGVTPGEISGSLATSDTSMRNIQFNSDGTALYVAGDTNARMNKYTLSTAYDITTLSSTFSTFDLGSRVDDMRGFIFAANFTKLFVTSDKETAATTDKIHEYDLQCAGTIACTDPSANADVKAIIEANVEMSKRVIRNNTLPIFHRIEWLRRHKNKDNLSNLNANIDFQNQKVAKLVSAFDAFKKERDRTYRSNDWFDWSEGRFIIGEKNVSNTSSRDIQNYGISFGTDRIDEDDRDLMYGYVFQFGKDDVDIGSNGSNLNTNTYSLAAYRTKIRDNDYFTDSIIGLSLLEIDHRRVINGNKLEGNRNGHQIFGSMNFGKRLHNKDINLNPGVKFEIGYTKLKPFNEKTILGSSLADALHYKDQNIKTAIATIGVLFDTTDKGEKDKEIINHHGRLEFIGDLSPSSNAEFYYLNNQSTIYEYESNNRSKYNYRIGYGIDRTSITGWSTVVNIERFGTRGGYYDEFYLSLGYVPIDEMKFSFDLDETINTSLKFSKKIDIFDFKISTDYNFFVDKPNYSTDLLLSNSF
jgi:outer membrane autotransporter protein